MEPTGRGLRAEMRRRKFRIEVTDRALADGPIDACRRLVEAETRITGNPPVEGADWSLIRWPEPTMSRTVFRGDFAYEDPDGAAIEDALATLAAFGR